MRKVSRKDRGLTIALPTGFDRIRACDLAGFGPIISRSGLYNATPERGADINH
jgi:hypothetical protein